MNEVTTVERRSEMAAVPTNQPSDMSSVQPVSFLSIISDAVRTGNVDVVHKLIDANERLRRFEEERMFKEAFVNMWPKLPQITKDGSIELKNKEGQSRGTVKFARLEDIMEEVKPILAEHGFALSFRDISKDAAMVVVEGELIHVGGHSKFGTKCLPPDHGPGRNNIQALGSSDSYAKRYITCDLLNLVHRGADDDGNAGGHRRPARSAEPISYPPQNSGPMRDYVQSEGLDRKKPSVTEEHESPYTQPEETMLGKVERKIVDAGTTPKQIEMVGYVMSKAGKVGTVDAVLELPIVKRLKETKEGNTFISTFEAAARKRLSPNLDGQFYIYASSGEHIEGPFFDAREFAEAFKAYLSDVPASEWEDEIKRNETDLNKAKKNKQASIILADLEADA